MALALVADVEIQSRRVDPSVHPRRIDSGLRRLRQDDADAAVHDPKHDVVSTERGKLRAHATVDGARLETGRDVFRDDPAGGRMRGRATREPSHFGAAIYRRRVDGSASG